LVAINVAVYLLLIRHGGNLLEGPAPAELVRYGAVPYALTHPGVHCAALVVQTLAGPAETIGCAKGGGEVGAAIAASHPLPTWETVFTSMFTHASLLHIGGNMLFLAIFGPSVEDAMGRVRYLLFYLVGGVVALTAQVAAGPNSTAPMVGASGAIAAVLGGYLLLYPRARVLTLLLILFFFTVVELPAVFLLVLWFGLQVLEAEVHGEGSGGGIANFAHIGGFLFGLLTVRLLATRRQAVPRYPVW